MGAERTVIDVIRDCAAEGAAAILRPLGGGPLPPYDEDGWDDFSVDGHELAGMLTDPGSLDFRG